MIQIPLKNGAVNAHPDFSMRLNGVLLDFEVNYLTYLDNPMWSVDIYNDGSAIALGAMLCSGADILENYDAGIGSLIFVGDDATLDNLGIANQLVWVSN